MSDQDNSAFRFAISLSVLNHLGRNLYRNFITVLGEAISNSWDADAENVWIDFDKNNKYFTIRDDGKGMNSDDFQNKFLKIGYSKRKDGDSKSELGRPFIGAKGIGKLALLSCAQKVTIFSRIKGGEFVGGLIDNSGLDAAITDNLNPEEYPLEDPDFTLIEEYIASHTQGTILAFEGADEVLRVTEDQIRKLLALSFHFSLIDPEFTIHVNGRAITAQDIVSLAERTQFLWRIGDYDDDFLVQCENLKEDVEAPDPPLSIIGYFATVEKPSHLKVRGADDVRASVDLFVNGRMRERNILRHIPTQRLVESYVYGQIHFDSMDGNGDSPFTSSREGIVETDPNFEALLIYLKRTLFPRVLDQWDDFRLKHREEGDDENPRRTKKQRKVAAFVAAAKEEYTEDLPNDQKDTVDGWLSDLQPDAQFNVSAYVDCFLSENLVRRFISEKGIAIHASVAGDVTKWRNAETQAKQSANVNFDVRHQNDDLLYLGMKELAICAEGGAAANGPLNPMVQSAIAYKPVRDAVGHTSLLAEPAKLHLTVTFENIKARVKNMLAQAAP